MSTTADHSASVRAEARAWIGEHWTGTDDNTWRTALVEAGWAAPTWNVDTYGRGLSRADAQAIAEEFAAAGAPGAALELRTFRAAPWLHLLGDPLKAFGSATLQAELLPKLLSEELSIGCLLYSEPGAGSDLAGLQTRAELDGDHYVVNGQKIWTTLGHEAQFALLIARTDWDVVKHAGLSFFVLDMDSPGIEVRPIKQITGDTEFNEVFLTDVRVPASRIIGNPGDGWKVIQTALAAERAGMGGEALAPKGDGTLAGAAKDLVEAARAAGRHNDPVVRQQIVKILSWRLSNTWTGQRALVEAFRGSLALANVGKLAMSRILHSAADLEYRLQGRKSLIYDYSRPQDYPVDHALMFAFINSIGGGSDQIQRNIISERVLGLPKGFEPDKGVPFREIRKGGTAQSAH
ncbi:acyl-CoA dehydrogenase family protein [[Mycobacterium] vasticus]|uniref:Acyl-CoA dehydrogenase family protein n=1 Tax=[Mycobacterium] vasticus TaxID=2875777 RepID=A0ABU5Z029_9MYCO|nr:acyl-CoA dehydrogenase family protein [Mycolicibacter sp. MYC017]MEB3070260.1 acyl-CoA dehydrogenase family protein [Mycolicibacter sp. MYC017]